MRPSWDETWLEVAVAISKRSRCIRSHAGCVLVSATDQVVATGYNGPPRGLAVAGDCDKWCPRAQTGGSLSYDDDLAIHAEANALITGDASRLLGGTAYVTRAPCFMCAKNLSNSGINRIVCRIAPEDTDRDPKRSLAFMLSAGIAVFVQRDDGVVIAWRG